MELTSNLQKAIENLTFSDIFINSISCDHLTSDPGLSNFDNLVFPSLTTCFECHLNFFFLKFHLYCLDIVVVFLY